MPKPDIAFYEHRNIDKLPTSDNPENDAVVCHASRALQITPGDFVLDYGCGDGYFVSKLADIHEKCSFIGFDIVSHRRWRTLERPNVQFQGVTSFPLPLQDETVDKIFCSQVIEHVPDAQALANEFARVLKPGGRIWLATPNGYDAMLRIFRPLQRRIDSVEGHVRHFTASQLAQLFSSDFSVVTVKYDLFVCLWLYYSLSYYLPSLKRRAATEIVKAADMGSKAPGRLSRAARLTAFAILRSLRRIDSLWANSPLCQVVEVTIEKCGTQARVSKRP